MALKAVLDKLDGLPEDVKKEYKQGEDGKFVLDVDGVDNLPSIGPLKRAKDHEVAARKTAETKLKETTDALTALQEERDNLLRGAIPKADVEKLEGSYKTKLAAREKELSTQIDQLTGQLNETLVDSVAKGMAAKVSKSPELMLPHIKGRLKMEIGTDGKAVTKVLDAEGKPSALTVADLEKEIVANPAYSTVIIGSKASGGGAGGGKDGGGAPGKLDFAKASPKEIAAHIKATKDAQGGGQ